MDTGGSLASIFIMAFGLGLSGAMMPGPLFTVTVREAALRGGIAGPLIVLGHGLLELLLVIGLALGLSQVLTQPLVLGVTGVVGGIVLAWMGQGTLRMRVTPDDERGTALKGRVKDDEKPSPVGPVMTGIVVSLSNPYWTLWWSTVGISYSMVALGYSGAGLVSFYTGHILSDLVWYTAVSYSTAAGRVVLKPRLYRAIMVLCGIFLLILAVYFIRAGVGFLMKL